jgi:hypothetical protein
MKRTPILACLLGLTLVITAPLSAFAQSDKPAVKKAAAKKAVVKKVNSSFSPQSDEIKALAEQFKGGKFHCEFNETLTIVPNKEHHGYLTLTHKKAVANMLPVPTDTGALRLESKAAGLVWLQLPTKSMLMNSKIGQRLADDCHATH